MSLQKIVGNKIKTKDYNHDGNNVFFDNTLALIY